MKDEKIAIVGMGAIVPGANNYVKYWNNVLNTECFIQEIPDEYWEKEFYYDKDASKPDKIYSKNAGVVDAINFDAIEFGVPPKVMQSTSVDQLFSLVAARQAMIDAGMYGKNAKEFDRKRTGVIVAANVAKNAFHLSLRTNAPMFEDLLRKCNVPEILLQDIIKRYKENTLEWDEASNPGYLPSLCAGRIANRFNLGGTSCSVDAACASGLMAIKFAAQELLCNNCDIMLAGGVTLDLSNVTYMSFCKTPALSPSDCIRPFDARGDGMLLGDGVGMLVLKRLSKAQEDKDRIYAVIEGFGTSSDGKATSIFNPNKEGQKSAILRALESAQVDYKKISMIEAHGTGTSVGDACEVRAITEVFGKNEDEDGDIVLSSAKGQIGHLRLAAGIIGVMRTSLALYHKQFLTTVGCEVLNPELEGSRLHICKQSLPWITNNKRARRYAGVSAFGFGGTNCHIILSEGQSEHKEPYRLTNVPDAFIFDGNTEEELILSLKKFLGEITTEADECKIKYTYRNIIASNHRLAFLAADVNEALKKAKEAIDLLENHKMIEAKKKKIIYRNSAMKNMKIAAVFPGQGTQGINMLNEMTCAYPELREAFTKADNILISNGKKAISELVYARVWSPEEAQKINDELVKTLNSQMSLAASELGLYNIAKKRMLQADYFVGHSFGELSALCAANVIDENTLIRLAYERGSAMGECSMDERTGMTAIMADYNVVQELVQKQKNVYIANVNSTKQIVVCGLISELEKFEEKLEQGNMTFKRLKVQSAFHSKYMNPAKLKFKSAINSIQVNNPKGNVLSNYSNQFYKTKTDVENNLCEQIVNPVLFLHNIQKLADQGANVFVEIGNGSVLKRFIQDIADLDNVEVISLEPNGTKSNSVEQFEYAMLQLAVLGVQIKEDPYKKDMNSEFVIPDKKGTYLVPPTYFKLPETIKRCEDSVKNIPDYRVKVTIGSENEENDNAEGSEEDMNKLEVLYNMSKENAGVLSNYLETQKTQMEYVKNYTEKGHSDGLEYSKLLFHCFSEFQNNSVTALKTYFVGQSNLLDGQGTTNIITLDDTGIKQQPVKLISQSSETDLAKISMQDKKAVAVKNCDTEAIKGTILNVFTEQTGYPIEMIDLDMELEGELGIDSIKRIEIFSQLNDSLDNIFCQDDMVELAGISTVSECIDYVTDKVNMVEQV